MKTRELVSGYWQGLTTAVLAGVVFCVWLFGLPHLMLAREQMQLFLWNTDYLTERLAVAGGLSQWLGELIVQFFLNPVYGACWYTLFFVAIQQLTWGLFRSEGVRREGVEYYLLFFLSFVPAFAFCYLWTVMTISMTLTVAFILILLLLNVVKRFRLVMKLISLVVLIPIGYWLVGSDWNWGSDKVGTHEEMRYDMLLRQGRWDAIVKKYQETGEKERRREGEGREGEENQMSDEERREMAILNAVRLAACSLGQISQQDMMMGLVLTNHALRDVPSCFIMSEVGLQVGMVNVSQRAAFEAMETIPYYNKSARALRRLVETNIVTGQYDVALKYIAILEETLFYRGWARRMKPLAEHPEMMKDYPYYHRLKEIYDKGKDGFFY